MLKIKTLNDLEVEDVGIVKKIDGDEMIKRRLLQ